MNTTEDKAVACRQSGALFVGRAVLAYVRIGGDGLPTFRVVPETCTALELSEMELRTRILERWAQ